MKKKKIGIIMGGFTAERHVSVESGRNIYNKLAASAQYTPIPIFLSGTIQNFQLFIIPIYILLKDSADDIHERLLFPNTTKEKAIIAPIQQEAKSIISRYVHKSTIAPKNITYKQLARLVDFVFLALHGRPGEDGVVQAILEKFAISYNGSGVESTQLTIDKFKTNQLLQTHGIHVPKQQIVMRNTWHGNPQAVIDIIEKSFTYPFIAKPVDDGCSTAVIKICNREMLVAYAKVIFSIEKDELPVCYNKLNFQLDNLLVGKEQFLIEAFIEKGAAKHFLEITGGLVTHMEEGKIKYEIFEPSEVIASATILSLEEKFLAGEGQNITPSCFDSDNLTNQLISIAVKTQLLRVAKILNLEGYARIDAFVKIYSATHIEVWIIEVNALPAMTPATCIFHQCALSNYTPFEFIDAIIQYGFMKFT